MKASGRSGGVLRPIRREADIADKTVSGHSAVYIYLTSPGGTYLGGDQGEDEADADWTRQDLTRY